MARAVRTKGYVVKDASKVVVLGGTGLIGSKLVAKLGEHDHEARTPLGAVPVVAQARLVPSRDAYNAL
jgi:hypothetical protein